MFVQLPALTVAVSDARRLRAPPDPTYHNLPCVQRSSEECKPYTAKDPCAYVLSNPRYARRRCFHPPPPARAAPFRALGSYTASTRCKTVPMAPEAGPRATCPTVRAFPAHYCRCDFERVDYLKIHYCGVLGNKQPIIISFISMTGWVARRPHLCPAPAAAALLSLVDGR